MKPSTIQLEEDNNGPGMLAVERYLNEYHLGNAVDVVDISDNRSAYYQNDGATLVLALQPGPREARHALALGRMATEFSADELSWIDVDGRLVVRLWWD